MNRAAILAGGLGTRLRSVAPDCQKVMADVGGQPFLAHLLRYLVAQGIDEIILLLGHRAEEVTALIEEIDLSPTRLRYSVEPAPLGTGGAVRHAAELLGNAPFFLLNGDTLFPVSLQGLAAFHQRHGGDGTLAVTRVEQAAEFGRVEADAHQRVVAFREKDAMAEGPALISGGVYFLTNAVFRYMPTDGSPSLERDVFPAMIAAGAQLNAYVADVSSYDIGTPERYAAAAGALQPWLAAKPPR